MATGRLKGFGWILGLATVSPACYMVSSMVAAERARVDTVELAILRARHDIRVLETEFDTRANLAQLERWNGDVLALSAPKPEQYVASEASLTTLRPGAGGMRYAALLVPAAPPPLATQPPALIGAAAPSATAAGVSSPAGPAAAESPAPAPRATPVRVEPVGRVATAANARRATAVAPAAVAMLDQKLLSDSTLGDLAAGARAERIRFR